MWATAFFGANRCLAGETEIFDPVKGLYRRVSEIEGSFHVFAWNGERLVEAKAHAPFVKGHGALFRVVLSNGKQITASAGHRILTPEGFVSIGRFRKGSVVCAPSSKKSEGDIFSEISGQFRHLCECGEQLIPGSSHTSRNRIPVHFYLSLDDIFLVRRQLATVGTFSFGFQSLAESILDNDRKVHILNGHCSLKKAQDFQSDYPACHHFYDEQLQGMRAGGLENSALQDDVHEYNDGHLKDQGSKLRYIHPYQSDARPSTVDGSGQHCTAILPDDICVPSDTLFVKTIEYVRNDFYYDFTVPTYHNYQDKSTLVSSNSGKTVAGAVKGIYHATGRYPPWWTARRYDNRATIGRIFAQDYKKGAKIVIKKLKEWLPKDAYYCAPKKGAAGVEVEWFIKHVSGEVSTFDILTYESDPFTAEGWDGDWVWFDEPPPRPMYIAAVRGLVDSEGLCWFSLTPLKEPWLFDEIYSSKNPNVFSVVCDMRHNLERMNPLSDMRIGLTERAIRKFEMKLTEEERETRAHGKFRYLAGRIWKGWDRDVHTFDRFSEWPVDRRRNVLVAGEPPSHWPRSMFLDPHDRQPHALLWVACDEAGDYWAYREGWLIDSLLEDIVTYCKKTETFTREKVLVRILDPNFGAKKYGNSGLTVRGELESEGRKQNYPMRFVFGDDHKELGRKEFGALLRFDQSRPIDFLNHPKFRAANDLKEFIYQIEHYVWDDFKSVYDRDPKEKPKDINTHFPDLCHYLSLSKFERYKPVVAEGVGNFYGG